MVGLIDENEQEILFRQEQYAKALIRASKYQDAIEFLKKNVYSKFIQAGYRKLYDLRYTEPTDSLYMFEHYMPKVVMNKKFTIALRTRDLKFRMKPKILIEDIMKSVEVSLNMLLQNYKVSWYLKYMCTIIAFSAALIFIKKRVTLVI